MKSPRKRAEIFSDPNDAYFTRHLDRLVRSHGGKWAVIAGGRLIGVAEEPELKKLSALARKRYPKDIPLIAPIPRREELECIL
jgi:hypothetical protein